MANSGHRRGVLLLAGYEQRLHHLAGCASDRCLACLLRFRRAAQSRAQHPFPSWAALSGGGHGQHQEECLARCAAHVFQLGVSNSQVQACHTQPVCDCCLACRAISGMAKPGHHRSYTREHLRQLCRQGHCHRKCDGSHHPHEDFAIGSLARPPMGPGTAGAVLTCACHVVACVFIHFCCRDNASLQDRSWLWNLKCMEEILTQHGSVEAKLRSHAFGATSGKVYHFRGQWGGLSLLQRIANELTPETKCRIVKPLATKSKNGKPLGRM